MKFPKITVVIPTYNEEKKIKPCLESIFRQSYPKEKVEVLVVDDNSTDKTREVAKNYPIKVLFSGRHHGEISKMIGFKKATGDLAIYLDADVELIGRNWFKKMIRPLLEDKEIIGVFTRKYTKEGAPALERYLSFDPLQRDSIYQFFSPPIERSIVERRKGWLKLAYREGNIPPAGRCLYRRKKILEIVDRYEMFLDLDFLVLLTRAGFNKFAYVPSAGLYHHHAKSLGELLKKRKYNLEKVYLARQERLYKWFDATRLGDVFKIAFWIIWANLIIPSFLVGVYKSLKYKDWAGMYEPVVNLLVTNLIIFSIIRQRAGRDLIFGRNSRN